MVTLLLGSKPQVAFDLARARWLDADAGGDLTTPAGGEHRASQGLAKIPSSREMPATPSPLENTVTQGERNRGLYETEDYERESDGSRARGPECPPTPKELAPMKFIGAIQVIIGAVGVIPLLAMIDEPHLRTWAMVLVAVALLSQIPIGIGLTRRLEWARVGFFCSVPILFVFLLPVFAFLGVIGWVIAGAFILGSGGHLLDPKVKRLFRGK
jgi:hypothetical protein